MSLKDSARSTVGTVRRRLRGRAPEPLDAALRSRRLLLEALCFLAPVSVLELAQSGLQPGLAPESQEPRSFFYVLHRSTCLFRSAMCFSRESGEGSRIAPLKNRGRTPATCRPQREQRSEALRSTLAKPKLLLDLSHSPFEIVDYERGLLDAFDARALEGYGQGLDTAH
jgi:hypothetical protein